MYNVVFEDKESGVITWYPYENKEQFDESFRSSKNFQHWVNVIAEEVTEDEAIAMCSTPVAKRLAHTSKIKELMSLI